MTKTDEGYKHRGWLIVRGVVGWNIWPPDAPEGTPAVCDQPSLEAAEAYIDNAILREVTGRADLFARRGRTIIDRDDYLRRAIRDHYQRTGIAASDFLSDCEHGDKESVVTLRNVNGDLAKYNFDRATGQMSREGKPYRKTLAAAIRKEICAQLGIPKQRLCVRWAKHSLEVNVIDTTSEELCLVMAYAMQHAGKWRVGTYFDDMANQTRYSLHVSPHGEHEDGILDTHEAVAVLDAMARASWLTVS